MRIRGTERTIKAKQDWEGLLPMTDVEIKKIITSGEASWDRHSA